MAWRKKAQPQPEAESAESNSRFETSEEDKKKARKWFTRARELGDKRQYDYAVEYYVNGLEFWPDAVEDALKPLHGCAVARKQSGGKKPGLKDSLKRSMSDKDEKQAFLNACWLFGHDPDNLSYLEGMVKTACQLDTVNAAMWAAGIFKKALESNAKSTAKNCANFVKYVEEFGDRASDRDDHEIALAAFEFCIEAMTIWRRRAPKDDKVEKAQRDMSTKLTILKGKYVKGESFQDSVRDTDKQKDLHDLERSVQSDDRVEDLIERAEAAYKNAPDDHRNLTHLVEILTRRDDEADEKKAIAHLVDAYKRTSAYRWKQRAEDIRIRQLTRKARNLAKAGNEEALKMHKAEQLKFELGVYKDRVAQYPTDLRLKFEYGVRLFNAGRYDDAIPFFQTARSDPKNRAACEMYLGRCFYRKTFYSQAIETLSAAIEGQEFGGEEISKGLHYWLGRAQEDSGDAVNAKKTYGKILQMDYNYRDVRVRLEGLPADGGDGE